MLVDEYQDCSTAQHSILCNASQAVPTVVLGDHMQAIFGFGTNELVRWTEDVCRRFPNAGQLLTPWRWNNAGAPGLGRWLLDAHERLARGDQLDLRGAPGILWVQLDGSDEDIHRRRKAAMHAAPNQHGRVLIIGDSKDPTSQQEMARCTPGAITVEAVEIPDLIAFANAWKIHSDEALSQLVVFAGKVMRQAAAKDLLARVQILARGTARKEATAVERAALAFLAERTHAAAAIVLEEMQIQAGAHPHRPAVLWACVRALQACNSVEENGFRDAVVRQREQSRALGRRLPKRGVGSTLRVKGLEADVVVVLNGDALDANNLYVAMTRGSSSVVVCSTTPILPRMSSGRVW
jgi:hypothetical protein